MQIDIHASLDLFPLLHLHQNDLFYGNFLFLNKILHIMKTSLWSLTNMCSHFFFAYVFNCCLIWSTGCGATNILTNCNHLQPMKTHLWTVFLIITSPWDIFSCTERIPQTMWKRCVARKISYLLLLIKTLVQLMYTHSHMTSTNIKHSWDKHFVEL